MDISYCDDKTGFPRPGHIYYNTTQIDILHTMHNVAATGR